MSVAAAVAPLRTRRLARLRRRRRRVAGKEERKKEKEEEKKELRCNHGVPNAESAGR